MSRSEYDAHAGLKETASLPGWRALRDNLNAIALKRAKARVRSRRTVVGITVSAGLLIVAACIYSQMVSWGML